MKVLWVNASFFSACRIMSVHMVWVWNILNIVTRNDEENTIVSQYLLMPWMNILIWSSNCKTWNVLSSVYVVGLSNFLYNAIAKNCRELPVSFLLGQTLPNHMYKTLVLYTLATQSSTPSILPIVSNGVTSFCTNPSICSLHIQKNQR